MTGQYSMQAKVNRYIASHMPSQVWEGTVAVVVSNSPEIHQIGTGILFQIADSCFVVTAAHVLTAPHLYDKTIGITGGDGCLISAHGNWIASTPKQPDSADPFDIAVFRLPDTAIQRLSGKRFFRASEIDFSEQSKTAVFAVFGFPGRWALPIRGPEEELELKAFEYIACASNRPPADLIGYDPRYHLLIDAQFSNLTDQSGSETAFTDRAGDEVPFTKSLHGVSGSSVWLVGDLGVPKNHWDRIVPKVVAVETAVYKEAGVIRATRFVAVTTLIHDAFPDLRSSIAVW